MSMGTSGKLSGTRRCCQSRGETQILTNHRSHRQCNGRRRPDEQAGTKSTHGFPAHVRQDMVSPLLGPIEEQVIGYALFTVHNRTAWPATRFVALPHVHHSMSMPQVWSDLTGSFPPGVQDSGQVLLFQRQSCSHGGSGTRLVIQAHRQHDCNRCNRTRRELPPTWP